MLVPNYQILKTSLKFLISLRKSTKSRRPDSCNRRLDVLSRWLKTKSQIKFIFSDLMFLYMRQWSSGIIAGNDSDDLGSIPGRVNFWNFKFWFLWYFHMFRGIYTHIWTEIITTTIAWWLCVSQLSSWSRVQFLSKSECPERSRWGILGIADLIGAVWRDQGPGGGWGQDDCRLSSGLHCHVICSRDA